MYEIAVSFAVTLIGIIVIPNMIVEYEHFCDRIDRRSRRRKRRKKLLTEYNKWYDKAKSCDNFGGAIDKGRAVAMLAVIGNELSELERGGRKWSTYYP